MSPEKVVYILTKYNVSYWQEYASKIDNFTHYYNKYKIILTHGQEKLCLYIQSDKTILQNYFQNIWLKTDTNSLNVS